MAAKGLTRRITRKQARSYTRTVPNPIGVTSIAAVNGRRKSRKAPAPVKKAMKACGTSLKKAWKEVKAKKRGRAKPASRTRQNPVARPRGYVRRYRATKAVLRGGRATRNPVEMGGFAGFAGLSAAARAQKRAEKKEAKEVAARVRKALKADKEKTKMARTKRKPRKTKAVKRAAPRRAAARRPAGKKPGKRRARKSPKRATARKFGAFRALTATVGRKKQGTYLHRTKKGKIRHIPYYTVLGFKSEAALKRAAAKSPAAADRIMKRQMAIARQRERASERVLKHGDIFTPNRTVIPFSEWSEGMTPNKKRPKRKGRKAGKLTKHERSLAAKKGARTRKRRAGGKRKSVKSTKRRATKRKSKLTKAQRSAAAKKGARTRKRRAAKGGKRTTKRKATKSTKRRAAKRKGGKMTKAQRSAAGRKAARTRKRNLAAGKRPSRKAGKRRAKRNGASMTPNRRRTRRHYEDNRRRRPRRHYEENRRTRRRRHYAENGRRRFRRNGFMEQLKSGLKVGAVIVVGFLGHKALTKVVADQLLSRVDFFNGPKVAPYKSLIAGVMVAAAAIPAASKLVKDQRTVNELAGGIAASLLHGAVVTVLSQLGQAQVTPYFAGYGDAMGEYVGQGSYGEYVAAMQGFGAYRQPYQQYGAMEQAAAGYGALQQAAAGYGALQQAAAGTGEFVVQGAQGYGEYVEEMSGMGDASYTYDGIPGGDLSAAEYALNVAEAAAGLGDAATQSTVDPLSPMNASAMGPGMLATTLPTIRGVPGLPGPQPGIPASPASSTQLIDDAPHRARAGVLAGGDGIFGGCSPMGMRADWQ